MQENSSTDNHEDVAEIPEGAVLAAMDLGSNSFHLIIAKVEHDEVRTVETLSEKVQLGAGLQDGMLSEDSMLRGLECLSRFKQVLDSVVPFRIHIVGTNALRQARNRREFTRRAESLLGVRVNVIYGPEEARLVYLGVAHTLADDENSRLVIDIGGGSTEFIVGQRFESQEMDSLQLGCVSYNHTFFKAGNITRKRYRRAYQAARLEVSHIRHRYHRGHWREAVGSSGTLQAIELILQDFGWSDAGITRSGLSRLEEALLAFDNIEKIDIQGLSETRRNVILSGVAISAGIFDELQIDVMRISPGALREGVIYDLLGRLSHEDVRERTINALMQRYNADAEIASTVERRAAFYTWPHAKPGICITATGICCDGRPAVMKLEWQYPTNTTTVTVPTCCETPTCPGFHRKNRKHWPCWCCVTGASYKPGNLKLWQNQTSATCYT